ncbi:MAG: hypothetical protein JJU37_08510 [Balneolaceae bacterium]|nr:hypothetical protein [Balneolaceae bacterium]
MRTSVLLTLGIFLLLFTIACDEDTTSADFEEDALGVFVENIGTSDLILRQVIVTFCYEGSGCVESNVSNLTLSADAGAPLELGISDTGQQAVGVIVTFQAVTGQGSLEIQQGSPIGASEFEAADILKVSDFGSGETVNITYGDTEF